MNSETSCRDAGRFYFEVLIEYVALVQKGDKTIEAGKVTRSPRRVFVSAARPSRSTPEGCFVGIVSKSVTTCGYILKFGGGSDSFFQQAV